MDKDFVCPNEHECSESEIDFERGLDLYCPICHKPVDAIPDHDGQPE